MEKRMERRVKGKRVWGGLMLGWGERECNIERDKERKKHDKNDRDDVERNIKERRRIMTENSVCICLVAALACQLCYFVRFHRRGTGFYLPVQYVNTCFITFSSLTLRRCNLRALPTLAHRKQGENKGCLWWPDVTLCKHFTTWLNSPFFRVPSIPSDLFKDLISLVLYAKTIIWLQGSPWCGTVQWGWDVLLHWLFVLG